MKSNIFKLILSLPLIVCGLTSCNNQQNVIKTTSITLSENTKSMYASEAALLSATIKPVNATDKRVIWSTSDNDIVEVNQEGKLTAKKEGKAQVSVKTLDTNLESICNITVTPYIQCSDYSVNNSHFTVDLDGEMSLEITYSPSNCSYQYLNYEIEDSSIISIDQNGKVKGLKEGETEVVVTHKDNNTRKTLNFAVKKAYETGLFIGNQAIRHEGEQFSNTYGNYCYKAETNTLLIEKTTLSDKSLELKEYDNVRISEAENVDTVKFLLSYEGTRDLHLELSGDINIRLLNSSGYVGYLYVKNEVNVHINGPSLINANNLTHSFIYGPKANFYFRDVNTSICCDSLCFGIYAQAAKFAACKINITVDKTNDSSSRYGGLYIGGGFSTNNSTITSHGFIYGIYCGTTYLYDSKLNATATFVGLNFYALTTYDSDIIVFSDRSGALFYDGLYMTRGSIFVSAKSDVSIASTEATLLFDNVTVNALNDKGSCIQAWRILAYNSEINASTNNGYCLVCNFNGYVPIEEKATILISNSDVNAETKGANACAIYGIGLFKMEDASFVNNEKYLFEEIYVKDIIPDNVFAICDKDQTELQYVIEKSQYKPTNGVKTVGIVRNF